MAYGWCSAICENRESCEDWKNLLLLALEIGFRHLDPQCQWIPAKLIHTEHHRELAEVVFESGNCEEIADLLYAWTVGDSSYTWADTLLGTCAGRLVGLYNLVPFPPRLRRLVIRSVELIGYKGFEEVGAERFVELLNCLHVWVEDMDSEYEWVQLLLDTIQSPEGARRLSNRFWELLVKLAIPEPSRFRDTAYSSRVMGFLLEAQEWDKLECWIGVIWMVWSPDTDEIVENLERTMVSLFRQRPGAAETLEGWMEQRSQQSEKDVPESFQQTTKRAYEATRRHAL